MSAWWKKWSARIDELSLRERALAFVIAALAVVGLAHALALQPLLRQQRAHLERIKQDESQLRAASDALLKATQDAALDPLAAKRRGVQEAQEKLARTERALAERRGSASTPEHLAQLLRDLVGRNPNLKLLALRLLPPAPLAAPAQTGKAAPKMQPGTAAALYRHAFEIEMAGEYLELLKYVEDVERLPWSLRWGALELKTSAYPEVRLRATLYTVSPSGSLVRL